MASQLVTLLQMISKAESLIIEYQRGGGTDCIGEAVNLGRRAVGLCPHGHPMRPAALTVLAHALGDRYDQLGKMRDLDEAIDLDREVLNLYPPDHHLRPVPLSHLTARLCTRYNQLGKMADLNTAIALGRETLDLCPRGNSLRLHSLGNLARCLSTRYQQLGETEDLDTSIVLGREALDLCPPTHQDRSTLLSNLAVCLSTRYKQLRIIEDLEEVISLDRKALDLRPPGHYLRSMSLNNLASHLSTRHEHLLEMQDLNEAIILDQEALTYHPRGHSHRSSSLICLAGHLHARYNKLQETTDLDRAISFDSEALELCPPGHSDRYTVLDSLSATLFSRYTRFRTMRDLDMAIDLAQEALDSHTPGSPNRSPLLMSLATFFGTRFKLSHRPEDRDMLFNLYARLTQVPQTVSSYDLSAAKVWVNAAEDFHHHTTTLAYETSLRFLIQRLATLPSLPQHIDVLKNLTSSLAVDAFSACLRNNDPAHAVELLEQGRGVFWSQLVRLRSPLDDVTASGPSGKTLGKKFTRLSSLIRHALDSPDAGQHDRVCHLNLEMEKVVTRIRKLPGFSRFLLPLLFSDLQHAAVGGPVIIVNASKYSCDALVVLLDRGPIHIPLQVTLESVRDLSTELSTLTERAKRADATRAFASFLRKLWDNVVSHIVVVLQTLLSPCSRIWWCLTAEFSVLPLHAAGPYRKGQQNLPDLYVSSYTPTLTALIRARRPAPSNPESMRTGKRFLAVGQANAPDQSELPCVSSELADIGQRVDGLATFTQIDGIEARIPRVAGELAKSQWVHIACHGIPDRKHPFESAFVLHEGNFTVEHIIRCNLDDPEFAYLSACHTTVGDEVSPDEVIHLAAAVQFIGFRSVIGTMWAVDDGETNKITSTFYEHMVDESGRLDHTRAAYALNRTMRLVNAPLDQRVLYIHLGA